MKPKAPLEPFQFERREVGDHDILVDIQYCGICHSDLHQVKEEWGKGIFPMVPGHEIVGKISRVGKAVTRFKVGDLAGVGCFLDTCRMCPSCEKGLEQYCAVKFVGTYNSTEKDNKTPTYGGYSSQIVVDEKYTLHIPPTQNLAAVAPLLCAGITTYSPIKHWKIGKGHRLGVLGLGGLGHMAVKIGAAMGAEVTVLSSSKSKEAEARRLGAHEFALTSSEDTQKKYKNRFDFIINTVSAPHNLTPMIEMLGLDGTMILLGVPPESAQLDASYLIGQRRSVAGSLIGGIRETQEMLDFCAEKKIVSDIELIPAQQINAAYERMLRGDVKYRFVIDIKSLI